MSYIPRDKYPDSTLALMSDPYGFISGSSVMSRPASR